MQSPWRVKPGSGPSSWRNRGSPPLGSQPAGHQSCKPRRMQGASPRCGEDRQGWQPGTSKFLARSKACGLTMDRQAHRQNSGRCCGNQQQGQGVSGLDDRQMLNGEAGQLGWTLRSRRDGSPFHPVRYAAAFGTSNVPYRKEGAVSDGLMQGVRIGTRSAVGSYSGTHQDAPAPSPTAQRPCSRDAHG